jgi:ATP-binding cassette subfamily B multidrug efflux pump
MRSLKDIAPFVRPYWWIVILLVLTVVLPVAMELVVPRSLQYIIDDGIRANSMEAIVRGSSIMLVAAAIGAIATLGQGFCRAWLSQNMAFDMRNALFGQIQAFSFGNLDTMQTGQLMTRLSSDVDIVRMFTSAGLSLMLRAVLMIAGSLFMMVLIDWRLFLVVMVILTVAIGLIWALMRTARPLFLVVQEKLARLNTIVQENLAGVQVVKAFVRERHEIAQFEDSSIDYMDGNIKVGRMMAVALPLLTILTNVGIVLVIWLGGADVINGQLSVGELIAFNNYLMIGMTPLLLLGNVLTMVSRADASAERILDVLGTEPVVRPALRPYKA